MPSQEHDVWLKTAANIRHLSQLTDKIKTLEVAIAQLNLQSQSKPSKK
jgi:UDP-3-O-[3-hydroxymyristoyl] glucosamine N-acyltransferase